jgi:hypothetical protein
MVAGGRVRSLRRWRASRGSAQSAATAITSDAKIVNEVVGDREGSLVSK